MRGPWILVAACAGLVACAAPDPEPAVESAEVKPDGFIGIEYAWVDDMAEVSAVLLDTPAEMAGLAAGDRIVFVDGLPMQDQLDFEATVKRAPIGSHLTLVVERSGKLGSKAVRVTTWPRQRRDVGLVDDDPPEQKCDACGAREDSVP